MSGAPGAGGNEPTPLQAEQRPLSLHESHFADALNPFLLIEQSDKA